MSKPEEGRWIIENVVTGRYLFPSEKPPAGEESKYPKCVGADANYLGRAVWKIILKDDDTYFIQNEVTNHYLFQTGDKVEPGEPKEGTANAPSTVTADDRNLKQVTWKFPAGVQGTLLLNVCTGRYVSQTGQQLQGDHGTEEGWANAPKVVGTDHDYYGFAGWNFVKP